MVSDPRGEDAMGSKGLPIRGDVPAAELRRLAVREADRAKARRMMAIANALEGMTRAEAARLAGMERQALRDAVVRYNAAGLAGLCDRRRPGPRPRLDEGRRAALRDLVLAGPDVERMGLSAWTLPELCREVEARWGVSHDPSWMGRLLHRLGLSRQKARPAHPKADPAAREAFAKGGSRPPSMPRARRIRTSA
jgi:transposase